MFYCGYVIISCGFIGSIFFLQGCFTDTGAIILPQCQLTHWGRVTCICVSNATSNGSDNGLSPGWRQAIIRTNAGILLPVIWTLGTKFSEIIGKIHTFSFRKMHLKMRFAKWRPFSLGLNVLSNFEGLVTSTTTKCVHVYDSWDILKFKYHLN